MSPDDAGERPPDKVVDVLQPRHGGTTEFAACADAVAPLADQLYVWVAAVTVDGGADEALRGIVAVATRA